LNIGTRSMILIKKTDGNIFYYKKKSKKMEKNIIICDMKIKSVKFVNILAPSHIWAGWWVSGKSSRYREKNQTSGMKYK